MSVFVVASVIAGQGDLGAFQRHAKKGGDPQPKQRAGSSHRDGGGHTANVANAHGAADGGGNGVERTDVARAGLMLRLVKQGTEGMLHEIAKVLKLEKSCANGKERAGAEDEDN